MVFFRIVKGILRLALRPPDRLGMNFERRPARAAWSPRYTSPSFLAPAAVTTYLKAHRSHVSADAFAPLTIAHVGNDTGASRSVHVATTGSRRILSHACVETVGFAEPTFCGSCQRLGALAPLDDLRRRWCPIGHPTRHRTTSAACLRGEALACGTPARLGLWDGHTGQEPTHSVPNVVRNSRCLKAEIG